jgi:DNA-binding SARP family transcriptional activator
MPPTISHAGAEVPAPTVSVSLLSGFEVRRRDHVIELPFAAQRLIAFLALHDCPLHRAYVAGTLWIDATEERAQAALRTTLWRTRQRACDMVSTTAAGMTLGQDVNVDLRRAGDCARRALRRAGPPEHDDIALLCDAGDLLPDWYEDWLAIERERFRQLRLLALDSLCEEFSAQGRYSDAVMAGLASVAAEPLRESAHRGLIGAHLAAGNPGEARRAYELFRTRLREQLGLEPSPAMRALLAR